MLITAGIDAGAVNTKALLLSEDKRILGRSEIRSGSDFSRSAEEAYTAALKDAGISRDEVVYVVSTGFGRNMVKFRDARATDVTAHAQGALYYFPETRSVLDIGAQSTRACQIESNGRVKTFRMNAKCAAGAGMFLVRVARYLQVPIEEMGSMALESTQIVKISSVCAVLAETEIINQITAGAKLEDIVRGVTVALADQALTVAKRTGLQQPLTMTGGLARNEALIAVIEKQTGHKVNSSPDGGIGSYYAGALGAALLAFIRLRRLQNRPEPVAAV